MKTTLAVALLVVGLNAVAVAQGGSAERAKALAHRGSVKIWIGSAFVVAGAVTVPATATNGVGRSAEPTGHTVLAGVGLAAVGGALIWSGVQDQRHASSPSTTVGIRVGRTTAVQIRRSW